MTPVKRALLEIRDLRARLAAAEAARAEPIAIVGMGLRFPGGANDAESFAQAALERCRRGRLRFPAIAGRSMRSTPRTPMRPAR